MKLLYVFSMMVVALLVASCSIYEDVDPHVMGWRSPALSAPDQYGREISLKETTTGPWAVVFFYPKADTPG